MPEPRPAGLPTGTVTFLFSDIEGSTLLVQRLGDRYPAVLERHQRLLRDAFEASGGTVVGTEGDSFFVVFPEARRALGASVDGQRAMAAEAWPDDARVAVRMGLHTGEGALGGGSYVGVDVHRAARIAAAGHGGQVLLSDSTRALVEDALPEAATLLDLGEHRLKDLLKPERLFQLVHPELRRNFPPPVSLTQRPNNLPTQTSEFLGREEELRALADLLGDGVRLVTLTGPGGIGKTRLALQAAAEQAERFQDGVYFVDLSAAREPAAPLETIARAAGVGATSQEQPLEVLQRELQGRRTLLLLDNFEQVMDAAPAVAGLLGASPDLKVLVTSREALRVRGEQVLPVPPMSVPPGNAARIPAEAAAGYEAIRLFVERAQEAEPGFALTDDNAAAVAEICARLDGLPLAIELAVARLKLFSAEELLGRLRTRLDVLRGGARDLPARQQTLRSAIEWSYELLDEGERAVFRLFSVFSSATVAAVEEVATRVDALGGVDVVEGLASLADKSLVRTAEGDGSRRLTMFETIREFAAERLDEHGALATEARRAHAEFFQELASTRRERLEGPDRETGLDELEAELGNLLLAWRHWVGARDAERLDQLLDPLWELHEARGWYSGAVELARDLLGLLSATPSGRDRTQQEIALATSLARGLLALRGYTDEVDQAYRRVLALLDEAGGLPQLFPVLRNLATLHLYRAEFDDAIAVGRQLLELAEREGDVPLQVHGHLVVGANLGSAGDVRAGLEHLERAIDLFDPERQGPGRFRFGPSPGVVARTTAALFRWATGYPDRAVRHASSALELATRLGHPYTLAYGLFHVAFLDAGRGEFGLAHERASRAAEVAEEHGYEVWGALALVLQGLAMVNLGRPEEGLERSDRGIAAYQGLETPPVFWPVLLSVRAGTLGLAGRLAEGLEAIDGAIDAFGERPNVLLPELLLIKGDLLLGASGPAAAEPLFRTAFEVGAHVGARMSQLRAAKRLVRLSPDGGDAVRMLQEVFDTFEEGFDAPDLVEARALLDGAHGAPGGRGA